MRISIHALREEGDVTAGVVFLHGVISIHALREEGDPSLIVRFVTTPKFLSTPSARRATQQHWDSPQLSFYFYPRPPRGGRLQFLSFLFHSSLISIHALREEGDTMAFRSVSNFRISIHALREEGDHWIVGTTATNTKISIHALREEGDMINCGFSPISTDFYPRPPRGGRPFLPCPVCRRLCYFYPRPPRGGRRSSRRMPAASFDFYPRPPRGGRPRPLTTTPCS